MISYDNTGSYRTRHNLIISDSSKFGTEHDPNCTQQRLHDHACTIAPQVHAAACARTIATAKRHKP